MCTGTLCEACAGELLRVAGASDPSDFAMPQQPLSRCLFPQSSTLQSLSAVTNPYSCQIGGVRYYSSAASSSAVLDCDSFHGTSGQPIDHLHSFTQTPEVCLTGYRLLTAASQGECCDRLELMENCLKWRSCVPTAPETTGEQCGCGG